MINGLYNATVRAYLAIVDVKHEASAVLQRIERGDADSSGSTLRTVGIVVMVIAAFALIDSALGNMATNVVKSIGSPSFK